jgi:[acyl-carrier-protein] S-malonyltransferase
MTLALLCSGQGRQHRGMFAPFADRAAPILDAASATLGRDIRQFVATAPEVALHANRAGQILCVARALATMAALFPDGAPPQMLVAGYSVGEVAAWGVAGVWTPAETLALVDVRAAAMDQASGPDDGLGYVRGLARPAVDALAARFGCAVAIVNPDRLFVIGGARGDVAALCAAAPAEGAVRAAPMPVHVASHTPRLTAAVAPFAAALDRTVMARPALRLMTATHQRLVALPARATPGLAAQIATMIDWAATLEALAERGVRRVLELGPGSALAEMVSAAIPNVSARAVDDFRTVQGVRDWLDASGP